jgi:hypothetical protein
MKIKLGKFERKARQQECRSALNLLAVMQEHLDNDDISAVRHFVRSWTATYQEWLEELEEKE